MISHHDSENQIVFYTSVDGQLQTKARQEKREFCLWNKIASLKLIVFHNPGKWK